MGGKVYVIGLDGATFDVIEPLIKSGRLKNIARAMEGGAWGRLRSTVPAFSPVAWTSMITGVNPGKTGIGDAFIHDTKDYRMSFVNSTYRRYKPLWSVMNSMGRSTGIFNIPVTYPPEQVNGFMVSGMFTPENATDFIYPEALGQSIREKFGKYIFEAVQSPNPDRVLRSTDKAIEQRDSVISFLLDGHDLDFYFIVFVETDRIQHQFWKYIDPESGVSGRLMKRYGNVIGDMYERLDESVGKILGRVGKDDWVVFVSDHGFGPLRKAFALNNWLQQNGYCSVSADAGVMKPSIFSRILKKLGKPGAENADLGLNSFFSRVNWTKTKAYNEGAAGGIFINLKGRQREGIVSEEEYEPLRDEIIARLGELCEPSSGLKVVEKAYKKEEAYSGDSMEGIPDIIVTCTKGFHTISPSECLYYRLSNKEMFFPHSWSGAHDDYGIFIVNGPGAKKGDNIEGSNITDIAPTVLYLAGLPVCEEFDGRILSEAIEDEYLAKHPPKITGDYGLKVGEAGAGFSDEETRLLQEQLRNLGYI